MKVCFQYIRIPVLQQCRWEMKLKKPNQIKKAQQQVKKRLCWLNSDTNKKYNYENWNQAGKKGTKCNHDSAGCHCSCVHRSHTFEVILLTSSKNLVESPDHHLYRLPSTMHISYAAVKLITSNWLSSIKYDHSKKIPGISTTIKKVAEPFVETIWRTYWFVRHAQLQKRISANWHPG